jgi:hypothetical protein
LNIALTTYHKDQSLNNAMAHALATRVFKEILNARSCKDLLQIVESDPVLYRNRLNREDYPELRLFISTEEIKALKASGVLTQNGRFHADLSATNMSPLEKLLYAMAWKNGDLSKIAHIVDGVHSAGSSIPRESGPGQVFHQFGRHLADRNEPIIDQHVLRGFKLWKTPGADEKQTNSIRRMSLLDRQSDWIGAYKLWLKTAALTTELRQDSQHVMNIDSVLFALGKTIKLGRIDT